MATRSPEVGVPVSVRESGRLMALEGLRGLLATSVLVSHVYHMGLKAGLYARIPGSAPDLLGSYAVCLFFCVSGFVILQSLIHKRSIPKFVSSRIARIYLVFLVFHLAIFIAGPLRNYEWLSGLPQQPLRYAAHFTSNLLFLPGVFNLPLAQKNAWSLSYEAAFYILAASMFWAYKLHPGERKSWMVLLAAGLGSGAMLIFHPSSAYFLIGILCYWLTVSRPEFGKSWTLGPVGLIGLLVAFPAYLYSTPLGLVPSFVVFLSLVKEKGWLAAFLKTPLFTWLGKISYSLYLIHPFVLDMLRGRIARLAPSLGNSLAGVTYAVISMAAAIAAAALSYHLIERALTQAVFHRRKRAPVKVAAANAGLPSEPSCAGEWTVG